MRPRNNREREVMRLHRSLPALTEAQLAWIRNRAIPHKVFDNGGKGWCSKCGSSFEIAEGAKMMTCPHCGARLPIDRIGGERKKRKFAWQGDLYAQFLTTKDGFQVIRYFSVEFKCKRGEESRFTYRVVMEKWCQPGRPTITLGVPVVMLPGYSRIPYSHYGFVTIKSAGSWWYQEWMYVKVYPRIQLLDIYKKTVVNARSFGDICADDLLAIIYSNPYFEALYKAGKRAELKEVIRYHLQFSRFWPSVKVALRHGFKPQSWYNYFDYLGMLAFLHKDMRSPHYVAPSDWEAMHAQVCKWAANKRAEMERRKAEREAIRRAEQLARQEEERKAARKSFSRRIAKFKDLRIEGLGIVIQPLMSIKEFAEEGNAMGHCVFSYAYYNRPQSLILSARREADGGRIETIEVDLQNLRILQSRGKGNQFTDRHEDILDLINKAMPTIDTMAHTKRRKIAVSSSRS